MNKKKYSVAGIEIPCPIVVASSPCTETKSNLIACAEAGAGAAIIKSCLTQNNMIDDYQKRHFAKNSYGIWGYSSCSRELLKTKTALQILYETSNETNMLLIPSIAGLTFNCNEWLDTIESFNKVNAKVIQLDFFYLNDRIALPDNMEKLSILLNKITSAFELAIIPKLNIEIRPSSAFYYFENTGIAGWSLLDSVKSVYIPDSTNLTQRICYPDQASLFGEWQFPLTSDYLTKLKIDSKLPILAGGGINNVKDIQHLLNFGADAVQVCTAILKRGPRWIKEILEIIENIPEENYINIKHDHKVLVNHEKCTHCYKCLKQMMCENIVLKNGEIDIDQQKCERCGFCVCLCECQALKLL